MRSRTPAPSVDERTREHAYVACGQNLYYVLNRAKGGELMLEDCRTLQQSLCSEQHLLGECRLVRAAPAPVPRSGWAAP